MKPSQHLRRRTGFTLVELLVVIAILAVLAGIVLAIMPKAKLAGAKANGITQMKSIGAAVASWMADKGASEPFYFSSGTGDDPFESTPGPNEYLPGNPAMALYGTIDPATNRIDPDAGYLQNPEAFFSPLVKATIPTKAEYDPTTASAAKPWGTYTWYYPFVQDSKRNERQKAITDYGYADGSINPALEEQYMMSECYQGSLQPKFNKKVYNALMRDGSVQYVSDTDAGLKNWQSGR